MRKDIFITLGEADRQRLEALVADRNTAQKHVCKRLSGALCVGP